MKRALLLLLVCVGCDDQPAPTAQDAAVGPPDPPGPMCVEDPMTHLEIINACTMATSVSKVAVTPLLNADGSLPPLP